VKAAILEGDLDRPNLIATSVYDTKPVHYLSMVSKKIEWIAKQHLVYNMETGRREVLRFLQLNQISNYNHSMGDVDVDVDVADLLRGSYRFDH